MQIGIFSKTFEGDIENVFQKMSDLGIYHTQFNLASAGMETLPDSIDETAIERIRKATDKYKITLDALSGTFNMIDPDMQNREDGIKRFEVICEIANMLQIPIVTLCTGSKNPNDKWKWDDENLSDQAWNDLLKTTEQILEFAQKNNIILGVETEASNIINTPQKARNYLDKFQSKHLKIIMDGANLFLPSQIDKMESVLHEAFELLGEDIVLAHAKDIACGKDMNFVAAGQGILNFKLYIHLLKKYNYHGALIMHGLSEKQIPDSMNFLKGVLRDA